MLRLGNALSNAFNSILPSTRSAHEDNEANEPHNTSSGVTIPPPPNATDTGALVTTANAATTDTRVSPTTVTATATLGTPTSGAVGSSFPSYPSQGAPSLLSESGLAPINLYPQELRSQVVPPPQGPQEELAPPMQIARKQEKHEKPSVTKKQATPAKHDKPCTLSSTENSARPSKRKNMYSHYVGVSYNKRTLKYTVTFCYLYKQYSLGSYKLACYAARVHDQAVELLNLTNRKKNFDSDEEYNAARKREIDEIIKKNMEIYKREGKNFDEKMFVETLVPTFKFEKTLKNNHFKKLMVKAECAEIMHQHNMCFPPPSHMYNGGYNYPCYHRVNPYHGHPMGMNQNYRYAPPNTQPMLNAPVSVPFATQPMLNAPPVSAPVPTRPVHNAPPVSAPVPTEPVPTQPELVRQVTLSPSNTPEQGKQWELDELLRLDDAITITSHLRNHICRYHSIAEHVKTRTSGEVSEVAALIDGHGSVEQYILHLYPEVRNKKKGITKSELKEYDVVFGQGFSINQSFFKGTVYQRKLIEEHSKSQSDELLSSNEIARRVVFAIFSKGGRFLKKEKKIGDGIPFFYEMDQKDAIEATLKRVKQVERNEYWAESLRRHIAEMDLAYPAPQGGRPTLENMLRDYRNNPNDQGVIDNIKRNMYPVVLDRFKYNQGRPVGDVGDVCHFCPIAPAQMQRTNQGKICVIAWLKMNRFTRGMPHNAHVVFPLIVENNDPGRTVNMHASNIRADNSHNFGWFQNDFFDTIDFGVRHAQERGYMPADITGQECFIHFKIHGQETQRMTRPLQAWLQNFFLAGNIIEIDLVLRIEFGGATGVVHPETIIDIVGMNGDDCDIRIRGEEIV